LWFDNRSYDSKAIAGAAHGYAEGRPTLAREFSGGARTVQRRVDELGFRVTPAKNPDWVREEVILACALVADNGWRELRASDPQVRDLSELLQRMPIHAVEARGKNFRSPDSVSRKTADLMTAHPGYVGKRTKGGKTDREVLQEFLQDPHGMKATAASIRVSMSR
jgi:5-methylcytosine-specific restriction protein A